MISFKRFLLEEGSYTPLQRFVISAWGRLLYLDYLSLPKGKDESHNPELLRAMRDYAKAEKDGDDDEIEAMDEWIGEGAPLKSGVHLLNRTTVDAILSSAQHPIRKAEKLNRFDSSGKALQPNSWISLTRSEGRYNGEKKVFEMLPTDLVIDAHGIADADEVIVNTNVLLSK